jgi:fimbrial chaperone protein
MTDMTRIYLLYRILAGCCLLIFTSTSTAGVVIGATRVVIHERDEQKDVHLRASGNSAYLVIARVIDPTSRENGASDNAEGFTVLPPAFLLKGGQERQLRIIADAARVLPRDRETMLYFMVFSLPESSKEKNTVQIAVRTWIKLFYRPLSLEGMTVPALKVIRDGDSVIMKNDSPFYISLSQVFLQGKSAMSPADVAPYGEKRLEGCSASVSCELRWMQTTNDNSLVSHRVIVDK